MKYPTLSEDEIRRLAACEREMDSGKLPYVVYNGDRYPVNPAVMGEMGLVTGQSVGSYLYRVLLEKNLAYCQAQLAIEKAQSPKSNPKQEESP